ncbi:hypothetical protein Vadar_031397 [Vaccinium darrowii]|uniref:Uncharacterized protein n=1 Tax=Vaccinium darrowii TaxID=229202 RepID=A0ACB7X5B3_9ERIC|nr:hypothetical protein Vadar_031397 [Vaccinium darrowii]
METNMDKSWMNLSRLDPRYLQGVIDFMAFARKNIRDGETEISCPCKKCHNFVRKKIDVVKEHLVVNGISPSYTVWIFHGERSQPRDQGIENSGQGNFDGQNDMEEMIRDAFGIPPIHAQDMNVDPPRAGSCGPDEQTIKFFKLLKEAEQELYPGCQKFSLLSFIVRLMHIKCLGGWSNKSFTMLLKLLKDAFPAAELLPDSFNACRKLLGGLGLEYHKVHACPQDCMLYWGEDANRVYCKVCHSPRYKQLEDETDGPKKGGKIAEKIVRYFPIIPKLKRLFTSTKTAGLMTWHAENPAPTGTSAHPVDSGLWKHFDNLYPDFAKDPHNVRLGLASDGFNPYRTMNISHSTWPVVMMTYNLPPWLCMKQPYMMLTLLIDGPKSPGNNIDVYLRLIVDELKELWNVGVDTYDALGNEMFKMRALLLWTINDFPALAMLSGWSTKGRLACPVCHVDTCSSWLDFGRKMCYLGHRRWLEEGHKFRFDRMSFDGKIELDTCPARLSGSEVLAMFPPNYVNKFGKEGDEDLHVRKRKRTHDEDGVEENTLQGNWKKKSIFFDLPYWEHNLLRHCLDLMHIQKNVCDNVLGTIMDLEGKGKDNLNARRDLEKRGIRKAMHPQKLSSGKFYLPPACFSMDNGEKTMMCNLLKKVKVPDGYASNISRCVNVKKRTISGLKSHDSHILMDQLLPIGVSRTLPKKVSKPLIELCNFFRQLCSKVLKVDELDDLQSRIVLTLCELEKIFPPSFFDIMEHLPIHLVEEAKIGGPVRYRWMYYVERYLMTLKSYVRNRARPEGSIAEGYFVEECMTFCSR